MKKFLLLSIGLFFLSYCTFGQSNNLYKYYKYVNKAELARNSFKNKKASKYYEKAFKFKKPFEKDAWQYMWVYANRHYGNETTALQCATYNAQRKMFGTAAFKNDSIFYKNITIIKDTTPKTIIPELMDALDSIREKDRQVRLSDTIQAEQRTLTDSLNLLKLVQLFETYGHIDEDNAGGKAFLTIQMVFIHNSKTQKQEPPFYILENAVRSGSMDARDYISLYDFCQYFREETNSPTDSSVRDSYFGTGMEQHLWEGEYLFVFPPKDIKQVNKNRKSMMVAETWNDYEKKLIYAFRNGGAGFVQITPKQFSSTEDENESINEFIRKIDSGEVKGKYIKGERFGSQW